MSEALTHQDIALPEKMDLSSMDIAAERQSELLRLFPR